MELPRELRQLEQMRRERQEWAAGRFPVTEQGLLSRFNPRTPSPSRTSPAAQECGQTQADSFEPVTVESPSSSQADRLLHKPPTSPSGVPTAAQAPVPASVSDLRKEMSVNSPPSLGVGRGHAEVLMDTMGRGRPFGKEQSSVPALPAIGRGFLLQMSQAQIPRESPGDMETSARVGAAPSCPNRTLTQEVMPQPGLSANDLPQSLSSSFRSFRY